MLKDLISGQRLSHPSKNLVISEEPSSINQGAGTSSLFHHGKNRSPGSSVLSVQGSVSQPPYKIVLPHQFASVFVHDTVKNMRMADKAMADEKAAERT